MMLVLKIIFASLLGISFTSGLITHLLIISYFSNKQLKSAMDLIIIDNIASGMVLFFIFYLTLTIGLFISEPIPYYLCLLSGALANFLTMLFVVSSFVTCITRYFYIVCCTKLLEFSDEWIRKVSILFKAVMMALIVILNYFGPFQGAPLATTVLSLGTIDNG